MKSNLFFYQLPKELIAQKPATPRDRSRLLILNREEKKIKHDFFYNLPKYLTADDVLVFNDTKVYPARLIMNKPTGGRVEILLLKKDKGNYWQALVSGKKRKPGLMLSLKKTSLNCRLLKNAGDYWLIKFNINQKKLWSLIEKFGQTPLPPYIKQTKKFLSEKQIKDAYQTIYAKNNGSVAAPTAGLHFTPELLKKIKKQGTECLFVTLHVGLGTFAPVKEKNIAYHKMHAELAVVDQQTAKKINNLKKQGKRIIAVGTTTTRVLESFANQNGFIKPDKKMTNIFIYPPYKFKITSAMITNFHLPQSTLLMLVSAFAGRTKILNAYRDAIRKKYRFYSLGDAMLIL